MDGGGASDEKSGLDVKVPVVGFKGVLKFLGNPWEVIL